MRRLALILLSLLLASCVTIYVYFPAAEVQRAAEQFVEDVIGGDTPAPAPVPARPAADGPGGGAAAGLGSATPEWLLVGRKWRFDPVGFFVGDAKAQGRIDITVRTPAVLAIQQRMAERFKGQLAPLFDTGALGFGNDGLVVLRNPAAVPLAQRTAVTQAVADENRDRLAVYREIAIANNQPDWEPQIRATFAREWVAQARPGWWYQDEAGAWVQK